jgi:hypothetical protein
MQVSAIDFIKSPAIYLDKAILENVLIMKEGRAIAVLAKPSNTPITDSLVGLLKNSGIKNADDLKAMRLDT